MMGATNNGLGNYLQALDPLTGDLRTRLTVQDIIKGIMATGGLRRLLDFLSMSAPLQEYIDEYGQLPQQVADYEPDDFWQLKSVQVSGILRRDRTFTKPVLSFFNG